MSSSPDTLSGNDGEREYEITVAPELRGKVTYTNVISPQGFFGARLRLHSPGKLFSASTLGYSFAFLTTENSVEMHRNGAVASVSLPAECDAELFIRANWTPTELNVGVVVVGKGVHGTATVETAPTFPPNAMLRWARKTSLLPDVTYQDATSVLGEVLAQLHHLQKRIDDARAFQGFWDVTYDGNSIISKKPKREVEIHPQIRLLLHVMEEQRGIGVYPEHPTGSGRLDFLFSAHTIERRRVDICVEFKRAHASDLAHGLYTQLPEYLDRVGTDYGIYCVLNFGADYPADLTEFRSRGLPDVGLALILGLAAPKTGRKDLRTLVLDVHPKEAPSKL